MSNENICSICGGTLTSDGLCVNPNCELKVANDILFEDDYVLHEIKFPEESGDFNKNYLEYLFTTLLHCLGNKAVFKGGYILNKYIPSTRDTTDIDLSIGNETDINLVYSVLRFIGDQFVENKAANTYEIRENISHTSSGRIKIELVDNTTVGIDVGLHDMTYGIHVMSENNNSFNVFKLERSLSDKISVLMSYKRFRRIKDLYDVAVIVKSCDLDYFELRECIQRRDNTIDWSMIPFDDNIVEQVMKAWSKFDIARLGVEGRVSPNFSAIEALDLFYTLISPLAEGSTDNRRWNHVTKCWELY